MNIITIVLLAGLSFFPEGGMDNNFSYEDKVFEQKLTDAWGAMFGVDVELYELFFIHGRVQVLTEFTEELKKMCPTTMAYSIEAGMRRENFTAGIRHRCSHPAMPYIDRWKLVTTTDSWYNELFIEVRGKVLEVKADG